MPVFLIYTFKDPALLKRVAARVAPHPVVVHVDAKVEIAPFRDATIDANVHFVSERVIVNWAGWSQVRAIRAMVRTGIKLAAGPDDHLVLLSGSDYPLRPVDELTAFLARHRGQQFLKAFEIKTSSDHYRKHLKRHFRDLPIGRKLPATPRGRRARNALIKALESVAALGPQPKAPKGLRVAHGGTHFALTAECLTRLERMVTPEIETFFSRIFCPEEKFYHSLLASEDRLTKEWQVVPYQGHGQWRYANLHHIEPKLDRVFTLNDWDVVSQIQDSFFIRKVQSTDSADLLDRIDAGLAGQRS